MVCKEELPSLDVLVRDSVDTVIQDCRPLIVLKGCLNPETPKVIAKIIAEVRSRGKELMTVQYDHLKSSREPQQVNGVLFLLLDDHYHPTNHAYCLDVDWACKNYEIRE